MLSALARIHVTRVGELAIASGETKISRDTALEKKSAKPRKLEHEHRSVSRPRRHEDGGNTTHKKREHCIVSAPGKKRECRTWI